MHQSRKGVPADILDPVVISADGFEMGDTRNWSDAVIE